MIQIIETTDKEKFEMYNVLDKSVLIGMLIECNKHLSRLTPTIQSGNCGMFICSNTGGKCDRCGKQQYEH